MKKIFNTLFLISFIIISCSKKDPKPAYKLDNENLSLHYDETHQFTITPTDQTSSITWNSSDTTVGKIDQTGYFDAKKIGTVIITGTAANYTVKSTVTVAPYSTMCKEPFYAYNQSIASTKSIEFRTLVQQAEEGLTYTGENIKLRNVLYAFDDNKMAAAALLLSNSSDVISESYKFFNERYTPLGEQDNIFLFTDNKNLVIGVSVDDTLGFNAIYLDYSALSTNSLKGKKFNEINEVRINKLQTLKTQFFNRVKIN